MAREKNPNLEILRLAIDRLGELADELVFVGGCATGLLISDNAAPPIRVTRDVDAIVQVLSHAEYYHFANRLRAQGFNEDTSDGAPICRWLADNLILDVMPTETKILGFGNRWYSSAAENAASIPLTHDKQIRMVSAPYFLITKLEAFDGRGDGDYLMSHDIEDVIAVLDGRPELINEVRQSHAELKKEISTRFKKLLLDHRFIGAVSGHMPTDETSQARVPMILRVIKELAEP